MPDSTRVIAFGRSALSQRGRAPLELQLEVTNLCNFNCAMCPRAAIEAPEREMTQEVFDAVLRSLGSYVAEIGLTGWGEPLTHPSLVDWIEQIKALEPRRKVRLTTNGALLSEQMIQRLVDSGLDSISISIDDTEPEAGIGHPGGRSVAQRIELLCVRAAGGAPRIVLQPMIQPDCSQRIERVIELARRVGADAVNLVRLDVTLDPDLDRPDLAEERRIVAQARDYGHGHGVRVVSVNNLPYLALANHFDRHCVRNFYHAYVNVDGELTPCCRLRSHALGSLLEHDLATLWRGAEFERFVRERHRVCAVCDGLKRQQRDPRGTGAKR
ncbi:MAG: radical SAM protein [Candidatus Alcyoniella australis]|nr:radical SAM protein [Candidatus Alcyoniella australis]